MKGPFSFIVTSRGCPAGCTYCIKHVSYGPTMRLRSPEKLVEEIKELGRLGVHNIHMYADLFTVNREQVVELCNELIAQNVKINWTCNSRVDYVDEEMLQLMAQGRLLADLLGHRVRQRGDPDARPQGRRPGTRQAVAGAGRTQAGIKNWGYFIIGLPGETVETIQQTIAFSKSAAARHRAVPRRRAVSRARRSSSRWSRTAGSARARAGRKSTWTSPRCSTTRTCGPRSSSTGRSAPSASGRCGPGPMLTYLKMLFSDVSTIKSALNVGLQHIGWARSENTRHAAAQRG